MKKYWTYLRIAIKNSSAYKADFILSLIFDATFFFVSFALWKTVYSEGNLNTINSYSLTQTITYFFATSILFRLDVSDSIYLNWQVWSGYFTNDLIKPWNVTLVNFLDALAEKILEFGFYIPVLVVIYLSAKNYIQVPTSQNILFFLVSVILAYFLQVFFNLILHASSLRFGDQQANIDLSVYIALFFSGAFFPLAFLPPKILTFFQFLPFQNIFYVPIEIFLGKLNTMQIYQSWIITIIWIVVFYFIYKAIYKNGLKYYSGTGR